MKINKSALSSVLYISSIIGIIAISVSSSISAINMEHDFQEYKKNTKKMRKRDVASMFVKNYFPTAFLIGSTIACVASNQKLNKKINSAALGACGLFSTKYKKLKDATESVVSKEELHKINDKIVGYSPIEPRDLYRRCSYIDNEFDLNEDVLFYDSMSDRYFTSTPYKVLCAEYHLNRNFLLRGACCLNDFYSFLDVDTVPWGDLVGWSFGKDLSWIDFRHKRYVLDDGLECCYLSADVEPDSTEYFLIS